MALLAQNTFSVKRLLKEPLSLEFSSDTIAIPASAAGVADLTDAEFSVRVLKDNKELFPVYDESVGGANLLLNTGFESGLARWNPSSLESLQIELIDVALKCTNISGGSWPRLYNNSYHLTDIQVGDILTLSFWAKGDSGGNSNVIVGKPDGTIVALNKTIIYTNEWRLYSFTFELNHLPDSSHVIQFYINAHQATSINTRYYKHTKLERGSTATPWTPNPKELLSTATITPHNCDYEIDGDKIKLKDISNNVDTGYVDVEINYGEGYTVKRRFTWAKVKEGAQGDKGDTGASYGNSNLINNGDFRYSGWWWNAVFNTQIDVGVRLVTLGYTFGNGYTGNRLQKNGFRFYAGDYTLLAKVRNKNSSSRQLRISHANITSGNLLISIPSGGSWLYVSSSFKATVGEDTLHFLMQNAYDSSTIDIAELMLVRGSTVPDTYKPSNEDIAHQSQYIVDAIQEGTTLDIEGGLVLGNIIGTKALTGEVKSYMSGLSSNPTAFAAGVKNFGTNEETKNVDIRHDGSGHLAEGNIAWDADGNVRSKGVFDFIGGSIGGMIASEKGLLSSGGQISDDPLETLAELAIPYSVQINKQSSWSDSGWWLVVGGFGTAYAYTQAITVNQECTIPVSIIFSLPTNNNLSARYQIWVENVITGKRLERYTIDMEDGGIRWTGGFFSFFVDEGSYVIHAKITGGLLSLDDTNSVTISGYGGNPNMIVATGFKRKTKVGRNGFFSYWDVDKYFYYHKDNGLAIKGNTDIPGVLATGSVASNSIHTNKWGAKVAKSNQAITKGDGSGQNTGIYNVPHNVGNTNYTVITVPTGDNLNVRVIGKFTNSIRISVKNVSNNYINGSFDYTIMGKN